MSRLVDSPRVVLPRLPKPEKEHAPDPLRDPLPGAPPPPPDTLPDYLERVAKYIPVEIIVGFMAIRGYVPSQDTMRPGMEIALFAALVALTPLYLIKLGGEVPRKTLQVAIATMSFVVWAYGIGGHFFWGAVAELAGVDLDRIVNPAFAGALVVIWSLGVGLVRPIEQDGTR